MRKWSLIVLLLLMVLTPAIYATHKDSAQSHIEKGYSYYENEEYDEAIKEYRKAIELDYNFVATHGRLIGVYKRKGKIDEITLEYQRMVEENSQDAIAHYGLGISYRLKGKSFYNQAIEELQEAIRLNPKIEYAHLDLGWVYGEQKKYNKAIEELKKGLIINPDNIRVHFDLGRIYLLRNRYQEAMSEYKEIIENNPDTKWAISAQYSIGFTYFCQRHYERAIQECQRLIDIYPKSKKIPKTYELIARCYEEMLDFEAAKKVYQKIIDDYPTHKIAKKVQQELINLNDPKYIRNLKKSKRFPNNVYNKIYTYSPVLAFLSRLFGETVVQIAILVALILIALIIKSRRKEDTISRYGYIKWGLGEASKVYLLILCLSILLAPLSVKLLYFKDTSLFFTGSRGIKYFIIAFLPSALPELIFPLYYVAMRLKEKLLILGITKVNLKRNISLGVRIAIIYSLMILLRLKIWLSNGNELPEISSSFQFIRNEPLTTLYLALLIGAVLVPLGEEVLFRGFLYPAFKKNIGVKWAILLSALFFAAVHFDLDRFVSLAIMGVVFTYLYERTKSLIPSVITHISLNATVLISSYSNGQILKQLSERSLYLIGAFAMLIFVVLGIVTKKRWIPKQYDFERSSKYCPNCKELFVSKERECNNCGYKAQTSKKVNYMWEAIGTAGMLLFTLLTIVYW